jgi:hypothetical protein
VVLDKRRAKINLSIIVFGPATNIALKLASHRVG